MNRTEQAAQFLDQLGAGLPETERVVIALPPQMSGMPGESPDDARERNFTFKTGPYKPGKHLTDYNNCFVAISSFTSTLDGKGRIQWARRAANFGHGLALMVDDIGNGLGSKGALTVNHFCTVLPPTVIVETSPGNHQLWYFLSEPEPDHARFKAFLESFVDNVLKQGGDKTIKDVSRLGRFPLGINNKRTEDGTLKYPGATGKAFAPRLVYADYGDRHSIDQIAMAFDFRVVAKERVVVVEDDSYAAVERRCERKKELAADERAMQIAIKIHEWAQMDIGYASSGSHRIKCPWGHEHPSRNHDDAHFRGPGKGYDIDYVFKCAHDTCIQKKRHWNEFVDYLVLPWVEAKLEAANSAAGNEIPLGQKSIDWVGIARLNSTTKGE